MDTKNILPQFIDDMVLLTRRIMIENGVEANSDLIKSVEYIPTSSGMQLLANDYYEYVSTGRRPKARKVPIEDLIVWIKKYGIAAGDINGIAWAIQKSIYENGIKGKSFINPVEDTVADFSSEKLADALSEMIADEMVAAFDPITK